MPNVRAANLTKNIVAGCVLGSCIFFLANNVQSATSDSATLQWAANLEPDLAGYRIYHGTTSGIYGISQTVGKTPTYQYTNLESNKTHYFTVTAYDTSGNESLPSSEVSKTITASTSQTATTGGATATTSSFPPAMVSPAPGSILTSTSVTFTGGHTSQDLEHWLEVGGNVGGNNLYDSGSMGTGHTATVSGLPTSGTIYVRYWTQHADGWWDIQDHTYTMNVVSSSGSTSKAGKKKGGGRRR